MRLSVIQLAVGDETKRERLSRAARKLDEARGSDLIVLPELWNVGYFAFDRYDAESEPLDGETVSLMREKAAELRCHLMMGSFVERDAAGKLHNTSVLIQPDGKIAATYRKMHLFGYGSDERRLLEPGTEPGSARCALGALGLSTCFDLRFPELYRRLLDRGAELFLVGSAWPHPRLDPWRVLTRARAIENQCFLAAANCAGTNRGKQYCGHSVIVDPYGQILAEAGESEQTLTVDIDLADVGRARAEFPAVASRVLRN